MSGPSTTLPFTASRRAILAGAAASFATAPRALAATPAFRLGTLPLGTATWEADTITRNGLDRAAGVTLDVVKLASNEAARIAFISGSVDTIVGDLIFAARLRAEGKRVRFLPYSSSEGGVMVAGASPVTSIEALRGKSIGVAGGPLDKSWILLRAAALRGGLDLAKDAKPVFGAPPLLSAKLEGGELDAALLYWNFCARLAAKGFREMASAQSIVSSLGAGDGKVALLGYLLRDNADPQALHGFAKASRAAKAMLASDSKAWTALRPIMEAPDEATFEALRQAFIDGIPRRPRDMEIADAAALFALLAKLGGEPLVGAAKSLPDGLYVDQALYG
jgi:NitT/TauT family transport system substrate-binding protein